MVKKDVIVKSLKRNIALIMGLLYNDNIEVEECFALSNEYINHNVLSKKSLDDSRHIACAIISNCDIIVSWNFKHLVNHKTISGVKGVNALNGYKEIAIYSPVMLLEGD